MKRDWYSRRTGLARGDLLRAFASEGGPPLDQSQIFSDSIRAPLERATRAKPNPPVAALAQRHYGRILTVTALNGERPVFDAILAECGLGHLFGAVVTTSEVARPKPSPDLFVRAAEILGAEPKRCLVLEDGAEGLAAAAAAGVEALDVRCACLGQAVERSAAK